MEFQLVDDDRVKNVLLPLMKNKDAFMESARELDDYNPPEMQNVFYDKRMRGCFISVKVPAHPEERGHALHFNVRCMVDPTTDQSFQVWPPFKKGTGHFHSKGIRRTVGWQDRLRAAASEGLNFCWQIHGRTACKHPYHHIRSEGTGGSFAALIKSATDWT